MRIRTATTAAITAAALTLGALGASVGVAGAQAPDTADDPAADRAEVFEGAREEVRQWRCEGLTWRIEHLQEAVGLLPGAIERAEELRARAVEAGRDDVVARVDQLLERLLGADAKVAERIATLAERQARACAPAA